MTDSERESDNEKSDSETKKFVTVNNSGKGGGVGSDGKGGAVKAAEQKRPIKTARSEEDTDSNIFALGEAAQHLGDLDDVLTGFGVDLLQTWEEASVVTETLDPAVRVRRSSIISDKFTVCHPFRKYESRTSEAQNEGVQVSVIQKKNADGSTIPLRIIQGPSVGSMRRIRVMSDTPVGLELLTEFEASADCDVKRTLERTPASVLLTMGGSSAVVCRRRDSTESYDNLKPSFCERESKQIDEERRRLLRRNSDNRPPQMKLVANGGIAMQNIENNVRERSAAETEETNQKFRIGKRVSFSRSRDNDVTQGHDPDGKIDLRGAIRKRLESVTEDDIRPYMLNSISGEGAEADVDEEEEIEEHHSICWSCAKLIKIKSKSMPKGLIGLSKGKSCLTSSEVSEDDGSLPGPQALLANYARMLVDSRPQFVETMFRAVKLNNVGVTRILCKIIQRCGLKLGQRDFREPESSATILHVALLYNHLDIVDFLLELGDRDLILAKYETSEYRNQTSLHVAVANGNPDLVERLILALDSADRVSLVNTLADGHYFKIQHPHGQMCLTAAAWAGNGQVIKTLVKHGGDLAMKDLSGNTLLHSIILQSSQYPNRDDYEKLFDTVWESAEIWAGQMKYDTRFAQQLELEKNQMQVSLFKELLSIRNNDGYTPLALATTKNSRFFRHMMNFEKIYKIPQNRLGSIAWVTYDVTDIASFARGVYNKFSVLHILAHNSQHLSRHASIEDVDDDFMEMEPVRTLLTRKWDVYRWIYILWFVVHLAYMVLLTSVTAEEINTSSVPLVMTPTAPAYLALYPYLVPGSLLNLTAAMRPLPSPQEPRTGFAIFTILPVIYLVLELLDLFGSAPYRINFMTGQSYPRRLVKTVQSEWTITGNGPYRMVSVGFSVFTICWFVLYTQRHDYQDMGLAMSMLLGWIFVLFFTRGCRVTCRFSIMIQKMFFRDLIYFLTVYGIVLIGFSFAMKVMIGFSSISKVFYGMMSVVTDLDQKQTNHGSRHPTFARVLLIFYAIIAVILLMNMLIAMMNTSYETVRVTRCNLWRQQQLSILLMMERRFFWLKWICRKSERDIWRKMDARSAEERCFIDVTMLHMPGGGHKSSPV